MLGYCGVNCAECLAYRGTITTDIEVLKKVAATYGTGPEAHEEHVCLGCTPGDQPFLAKYCATCKIRDCAVGRGVQNCASCGEYETCAQLRDFIGAVPAEAKLAERMGLLRGRFLRFRQERAQVAPMEP